MEEKICDNCRHYTRHYFRANGRYIRAGLGSCRLLPLKGMSRRGKACSFFEPLKEKKARIKRKKQCRRSVIQR